MVPAIQRAVEINLVARNQHKTRMDEVHRFLHPIHFLPSSAPFMELARRIGVELIYNLLIRDVQDIKVRRKDGHDADRLRLHAHALAG